MSKILIVYGIANQIDDYKDISVILDKVFNEKKFDKYNDIYIINKHAILKDEDISPTLLYSKKKNIMNYNLTSNVKLIDNFDYIILNYCTYTIHNNLKIYDLLYKHLNHNGKLIINYNININKIKKADWSRVHTIIYENKLVKYIENIFNSKIKYKKFDISINSKYIKSKKYNIDNFSISGNIKRELRNKLEDSDKIFYQIVDKYKKDKKILKILIEQYSEYILKFNLLIKNNWSCKELKQIHKYTQEDKDDLIKYYTHIIKTNKYKKLNEDIQYYTYKINYWIKK